MHALWTEVTFSLCVSYQTVVMLVAAGDEILKEMSQLAMLESLFVDSTDEFKFDPGGWWCGG